MASAARIPGLWRVYGWEHVGPRLAVVDHFEHLHTEYPDIFKLELIYVSFEELKWRFMDEIDQIHRLLLRLSSQDLMRRRRCSSRRSRLGPMARPGFECRFASTSTHRRAGGGR